MGCNTRTTNTNIGFVKSFFQFCVEDNHWLTVNPARFRRRRTRQQAMARMGAERLPFTDREVQHMLDVCEKYGRTLGKRYHFQGEDLEDFILISLYTGLRISDVASFHISRLAENGDVHFRALKNGKWVDTWIPQWLQDRIRTRAAKFGPYIFGQRNTTDPVTLGNPWRVRLGRIWEQCAKEHGSWSSPPTHHRFRHTFVRILLQTGKMTFTQVAELLGDTEEMVRNHYGRWVPERQDALRAALQSAFATKPKTAGKVVVIHQQP
jgi:integrase